MNSPNEQTPQPVTQLERLIALTVELRGAAKQYFDTRRFQDLCELRSVEDRAREYIRAHNTPNHGEEHGQLIELVVRMMQAQRQWILSGGGLGAARRAEALVDKFLREWEGGQGKLFG